MKKTIGSIESFTGGLFASTIISKPGASEFFKGSIVAYSNEIKSKLGIDVSNGVVNKEVALEMAKKGREFLNVEICVSFTGETGPSSSEKPIGTVFIAINEIVFELSLKGTRNEIRQQAVDIALEKLSKKILDI
ncbi:MAG: nicotinamide-nucleotide amidohydrolase family protein [Mycoplasmataceae bacterium]|nr:nicotinamide-nucleotide amidohydrolase family protein [Mycoplasmataceae bacterium]